MAPMWERVRTKIVKFVKSLGLTYAILFFCFAIPFMIHLGWVRGG